MRPEGVDSVFFAGGCFWCVEAIFRRVKGVVNVTPGYMGGATPNPTYESVRTGRTGHAEVVEVVFDPTRITFRKLLDIFWEAHDPTQRDRQGSDVGTQFRSAIFTTSREQLMAALRSKEDLWARGIQAVTDIRPAGPFYKAEKYHWNFFDRNPDAAYCRCVIAPKLRKMHLL